MKGFLVTLFLGFHMGVYRLSRGRLLGRLGKMDVLILTTRGRKSGQARSIPLTFFQDGGSMVIVGSNGGAAHHPGWVHNLRARPEATVELRGRTIPVRAEEIPAGQAEPMWTRILIDAPIYGGYVKKTSRAIPLVRLTPV